MNPIALLMPLALGPAHAGPRDEDLRAAIRYNQEFVSRPSTSRRLARQSLAFAAAPFALTGIAAALETALRDPEAVARAAHWRSRSPTKNSPTT